MDDIIIGNESAQAINDIKSYLSSQFKLKDLGPPKYFLSIEIVRTPNGIPLCQRKYVLDLLEEYDVFGAKPMSTPMDPNQKLSNASSDIIDDLNTIES